MAKLALAAGRGALFDGAQVLLPVDRRTADAAAKQGGETVLVYQVVPDSFVMFLGRGRIAAVEYAPDEAGIAVRLAAYAPFATPVSGVAELKLPRVRSMLRLEDERFEALIAAAAVPSPELEAQEAQASLDTRVRIKKQVLGNWANRCAVTGLRTGLDIVAIRPRELGGLLHARNYMPMVPLAARAWEQGLFSIGPNGHVVADVPELAPDLLESMDRSGGLLLPDDPGLHPDPDDLAFHFHNVFARRST